MHLYLGMIMYGQHERYNINGVQEIHVDYRTTKLNASMTKVRCGQDNHFVEPFR